MADLYGTINVTGNFMFHKLMEAACGPVKKEYCPAGGAITQRAVPTMVSHLLVEETYFTPLKKVIALILISSY